MKLHRLAAIALVCLAACGADDDAARTTEQLSAHVEQVRAAADDRDAAAFSVATADLRAAVATMQRDGSLSDEKVTSVLQQLDDVEAKFQQTLPTTTTTTTTTTITPTTVPSTTAPPPTTHETVPPREKGKHKREDDDD